ncbi:MAG: DNA-directed RNA polymerase subunit omega [Nannocystaceae bacterium]|nr:DNA-directed RNA polymerase subunit omega [Myxococcales bacterium]
MARVTVEDCLAQVPNRFALTVLGARRARALLEARGTPLVECDNKQAVTALREVSAGKVRYTENVSGVIVSYIEEQRSRLRASTTDNTYLEAVAFGGIEGDDDEVDDVGGDVEELTADLEKLGTKGGDKDDEEGDVDVADADESDEDEDEEISDGDIDEGDEIEGLDDADLESDDDEDDESEEEEDDAD